VTLSNAIAVERASVGNAEEVLALQKLAYVSEAEIIDFQLLNALSCSRVKRVRRICTSTGSMDTVFSKDRQYRRS
jgi:hypothetical protein